MRAHAYAALLSATSVVLTAASAFAGAPGPKGGGGPPGPGSGGGGKGAGIGADVELVLPVGELGDSTGPLIGALLHAGYRVAAPFEFTIRAGFLHGLWKDAEPSPLAMSVLPVRAGARYFFMDPPAGLYGAAEFAMNVLLPSTDLPDGYKALDPLVRFGVNLGIGYVISKSAPIDFRLQFMMLNPILAEENEAHDYGLGMSVGFTVPL